MRCLEIKEMNLTKRLNTKKNRLNKLNNNVKKIKNYIKENIIKYLL